MTKTLNTIIAFLTLFIIGTIPILFAAVQPWVWSIYCLLMIAVVILRLWTSGDKSIIPQDRALKITISLFFISTLMLCIPMPYQAIAVLSPTRAEIYSRAWALTGNTAARATLSYLPMAAFGWWVFLLSLVLFFKVVKTLCMDRKMLRSLVFVMIGIGLLEAVYGLIQAMAPSMGVLWVDYVQDLSGEGPRYVHQPQQLCWVYRNDLAACIGDDPCDDRSVHRSLKSALQDPIDSTGRP